jgi:hypothetical protein
MFAPNKQPFTPWPVGTDQWYETTRADGTKLRYKSAMPKQTKFDNCGVGESEVTKYLNTFCDSINANPTAASQRHLSEEATVPDSPLDCNSHHLIRMLARTSRRTQTSCPGLRYPTTVYRLPPPFAPGSHSRTSFRQQMPELRQKVVDRQARHKTWTHRRNRRQHKVERMTSIHGSRDFWRKPRRALERRVHKRQGMARRDSPQPRLWSHRPVDTVLSFGSQLNARFDGRA